MRFVSYCIIKIIFAFCDTILLSANTVIEQYRGIRLEQEMLCGDLSHSNFFLELFKYDTIWK